MSGLLSQHALAELTWWEVDLTLIAQAAPCRAHPLVVLEALMKRVFEAAGLDGRQVKQLWHSPGQDVRALSWEAGTPIPLTVQIFNLPAERLAFWQDRLQHLGDHAHNFTLHEQSPCRLMRPPAGPAPAAAYTLEFLTPVPLPHTPGQPNTALDADGFLRLCQTRLRKLFGREGQLPPAPQLDTVHWRYWRLKHRSRSQNGHPMFIHGCLGPLGLSGETLGDWLPWLGLFAAVGLGERLSFAQGRFRLIPHPTLQAAPDPPPPLRLRRPLVLDQPGAQLTLEQANLVVHHDDQPELKLPLMRLEHIALHAPCLLSTALLEACAEEDIPVLIAAPGQPPVVLAGKQAEAQRYRNLAAHHAAWRHLDDTQRARLGAYLVELKLDGYVWLIYQRYQQGDNQVLKQLARTRQALAWAKQLDAVRGWEGWAARVYHRWLARHMRTLGAFPARRRRDQAQDPVNVLLNYAYGLLRHHLACGVRLAGLDPWLGVLHQANGRHEALVSDLMEPWRPHVDRLVLRLIGLKIIQAESFVPGEDRIVLLPQARQRIVQAFTRMLESPPRNGGPRLARRIRLMLASYAEAANREALADWRLPAEGDFSDDEA